MNTFKKARKIILSVFCLVFFAGAIAMFGRTSYNAGKSSVTPQLEQTTNEFTLRVQQLQLDIADKQAENSLLRTDIATLILQRDEAIARGDASDAEVAELTVQINAKNAQLEDNIATINTLSSRATRLASIVNKTVTHIYAEDLEGLTSIGHYAFYECKNLIYIEFSNTIKTIKPYAFAYCENLGEVILPDSITSLGEYAFAHCYKLSSIDLSNELSFVNEYVFYYCKSLTSISLPNCVNVQSKNMFSYCTSLKTITIGNGVKFIPELMFYNCTALTTVNLPNTITTIYSRAFEKCTSLTDITLPSSVTQLYNSVFSQCTNLTDITILSPNPPTLSSTNAIPSNATLHVHNVDGYKSASNWSSLTNEFVEIA